MSEPSHGPDLAERLAEIDRRLRDLQAELLPERRPAPTANSDLDARLLTSMRQLLDVAHEWLRTREAPGDPAETPRSGDEVVVSAGPFNGTGAVQDFGQALAQIPGVGDVSVVGYEGANDAIFRVRLA